LAGLFAFAATRSQMFCAPDVPSGEQAAFSVQYFDGYKDELPIRNRLTTASPDPGNLLDNAALNARIAPVRHWMHFSCPPCGLSTLYLSHGLFNFELVANTDRRGEALLLSFARSWLQRLRLWNASGSAAERVHGRGGMGLVGAAYHDHGWKGVLGLAAGMALSLSLVGVLLRSSPRLAVLGLLGYLALGLTVLFQFMFVAPATLAFPFVMLSCAVVLTIFAVLHARSVRAAGR